MALLLEQKSENGSVPNSPPGCGGSSALGGALHLLFITCAVVGVVGVGSRTAFALLVKYYMPACRLLCPDRPTGPGLRFSLPRKAAAARAAAAALTLDLPITLLTVTDRMRVLPAPLR